ncbi:MAG: hypothetical protein V3V02_09505 [Rhizobiaceae bacterium]
MGSTEALMVEKGCKLISSQELRQRLLGNTILGDFAFAYKYMMTINTDGALEGINNVGSHHFGQMTIADAANTVSVKWADGWVNTTSRAYDVDGEFKLYNIENGQWSTTFTKVMSGTDYAMEPPV